ncbi:hypothetical protein F5J12DRAFT_816091 [Pisolithus orientalis]|uniref:uncharacterized protein n=1 Tax=Pisolithus orientalis TaxID=936130 RepID=UPI002224EA55|nr:uncharacterized protein F5J12DRAFT_816091 [Pisolithus orientalis]KAI6015127.1 hypothetical protein F5J12DRAFT_816091 [Pisolithus orientalis]
MRRPCKYVLQPLLGTAVLIYLCTKMQILNNPVLTTFYQCWWSIVTVHPFTWIIVKKVRLTIHMSVLLIELVIPADEIARNWLASNHQHHGYGTDRW